jgi:hypothetical protein
MESRPNISSSSSFYRLGAVSCVYYITAQLIQELTFHFGINDSAVGEAEILQRLTRLDQLCAILILGVHCDSDHYSLRRSGLATLSHPANRRRSLCGHDCRVTNDRGVMV